jgi:hypothetical protein
MISATVSNALHEVSVTCTPDELSVLQPPSGNSDHSIHLTSQDNHVERISVHSLQVPRILANFLIRMLPAIVNTVDLLRETHILPR